MFLVSYLDENDQEVLIGACETEKEIGNVIDAYLVRLQPESDRYLGAFPIGMLRDVQAEIAACPTQVEKLEVIDRKLGTKFMRLVNTIKMVRI